MHRAGKDVAVVLIRFRVEAENAMSLLRCRGADGKQGAKNDPEHRPHARLIKGLTGFATFAD